jgi:hypothetical protein
MKDLKGTNTIAYLLKRSVAKKKKFYINDTCGRFHKHFTCVTYNPSKISFTAHPLHALPTGCVACSVLQNIFAVAVSHTHTMFMKLTPVPNVIKLFSSVIYERL